MTKARPRTYTDPVATRSHAQNEVGDFVAAIMAATPLLKRSDFDWRVVQKWQVFRSQITAEEQETIRDIGAWFKSQGLFDPPSDLYRAVGVTNWAKRWKTMSEDEIASHASGFRSWADSDNMLDIFCETKECVIFHWPAPFPSAIVVDGRNVNHWLHTNRPELVEALEDAGDGTVGFDGDEYVVEPPPFSVVARASKRVHGRTMFGVQLACDPNAATRGLRRRTT